MFDVLVCPSPPLRENSVKANQSKAKCCLGKGLRSVHRPFSNLSVHC